MPLAQGDVLWEPGDEFRRGTRLAHFMQWLRSERGLAFEDYAGLWQWSVDDTAGFWSAIWHFFDLQADGDPAVSLASAAMPGARWFPDVRLNYAEHAFRNATPACPALIARSERGATEYIGWRRTPEPWPDT